jgi:hypothetical protein
VHLVLKIHCMKKCLFIVFLLVGFLPVKSQLMQRELQGWWHGKTVLYKGLGLPPLPSYYSSIGNSQAIQSLPFFVSKNSSVRIVNSYNYIAQKGDSIYTTQPVCVW